MGGSAHAPSEKQILSVAGRLSTKPGKPMLCRVADSNLRLYLATLRSAQEQARRGRPETAFRVVQRRWTSRPDTAFAGSGKWLGTPSISTISPYWSKERPKYRGSIPLVVTLSGAASGAVPDSAGPAWGPQDIVSAWPW